MTQTKHRPSVPGGSLIPDYGSGQIRSRAEGAKNPRVGPRYQRRKTLHIATYNVRTLSTESKLLELEEELDHIKWDILGLSEIRTKDENQMILKSGHLLHYKGENEAAIGGVVFIVHRKHKDQIIKVKSISTRVIYLMLSLNKRHSLKLMHLQVHTETKQLKTFTKT